MTTRETLLALADRCEREEPSHGLNCDIAAAIFGWARPTFAWSNDQPAADYTRSLDAAITLVPEGMEYELSTLYGVARVEVGLNTDCPERGERKDGNMPCALCAASLRARASLSED